MKKQLNTLIKRNSRGQFVKGSIPWTKIYGNPAVRGDNNPMKKKENKEKISKVMMANKNNLGKKLSKETRSKISLKHQGQKFSEEHTKKLSESKKKFYKEKGNIIGFQPRENHWNWQGGKSFISYPLTWTKKLRDKIRKRDNYICQICGEYGNHVHHLDYNKENCNLDNLCVLCSVCHSKIKFKKKYWHRYLCEKLLSKNSLN